MNAMTSRRDAAAIRLPPPLIPLATVLLGIGLDRLWPIAMPFARLTPLRYWAGGAIAAGAVLGIALWSVILMRRSGQSELPWTPTTSIVRAGPYRFTRNPMYLAMVIACVGIGVMLANVWVLVLTPVCAWLLLRFAILPEERYLEGKFGDAYFEYKRSVRRWL